MVRFDPTSSNALRHPLYVHWTIGFVIGAVGLWMTRLTLGYVVWELTQSPALTGLTAFLILAMPGILGPFFGVWIENLDPKRVIVWVQFLNLGVYLALAIIAYVGTESAVPYLIASGATGMVIAIWQPARLVLPTLLVSDHALGSAVAINSTLFNTARIIGPALAAWAIAFGGVVLAFFAGFLLYAFFFFAVLFLRTQHVKKDRPRGSFLDRLLGGIRQARAIPIVALAMAATMFSGFFGRSVVELMPAINGAADYQRQRSNAGLPDIRRRRRRDFDGLVACHPTQQHTANAGVLVRRRHHRRPRRLRHGFRSLCLGAVAAFADFWRSGQSDAVGSQSTILQTAPKAFQTRIMALWGAVAFGGMGFGGVASGIIASIIGLPWTLSLFGLIGACGSAALWIHTRRQVTG